MTPIDPWRFVATFAALAPCAVMAVILLRMGRGAFSARLAGAALAAGAMIAVLPAAASMFLKAWAVRAGLAPLSQAAFQAFVEAGLLEEAAKALVIAIVVRDHFLRRTPLDLALGAAAVALGFAAIENVDYVLRNQAEWSWVAVLRAITAAPIHTLLGLTLGGFFARAEIAGAARWPMLAAALLFVAALHGLYDLPLMLSARMPLYPPEINALARAASLEPWTLLAIGFTLAVALISASAILSLRAVRPQGDVSLPPGRRDLAERVSLAPLGDVGLPAALGLGSAFCLALASDAYESGAILWAPLQLAASALILATLAFLARPAFRRQQVRLPSGVALATALALCSGVLLVPEIWSRARAAVFVHSGMQNLRLARLTEAQDNFSTALSEQAGNVRALVGRSECFLILRQYDLGLADLERALTVAPDDPALYAARSGIRSEMHQPD